MHFKSKAEQQAGRVLLVSHASDLHESGNDRAKGFHNSEKLSRLREKLANALESFFKTWEKLSNDQARLSEPWERGGNGWERLSKSRSKLSISQMKLSRGWERLSKYGKGGSNSPELFSVLF